MHLAGVLSDPLESLTRKTGLPTTGTEVSLSEESHSGLSLKKNNLSVKRVPSPQVTVTNLVPAGAGRECA